MKTNTDIYEEGCAAFYNNKSIEENPYTDIALASVWGKGFWDSYDSERSMYNDYSTLDY
jgi:hypothetical protein